MPHSQLDITVVDKENGGLSSARNAGIMSSDADWIAFLDADDVWLPQKLERQSALIHKTEWPDLGLVYCGYHLFSTELSSPRNEGMHIDEELRGRVYARLFRGNRIAGSGSAVLVKRRCFDEVGNFDQTLSAYEDWDMWLRIAERYPVDYVDETLVGIREHSGNMQKDHSLMQENLARFYVKWFRRVGHASVEGKMLSRYLAQRMVGSIMRGDMRKAAQTISLVHGAFSEQERMRFFNGTKPWHLLRSLVGSVFKSAA